MNKHTRYLLEMTQVKEKIKRIPIPITRRKSVDSADCILNQNKIKHVNALKIHAASPLVGKYSRVVGGKNCPNNLTYFRNFVICLHVLRFLIIIFLLFFCKNPSRQTPTENNLHFSAKNNYKKHNTSYISKIKFHSYLKNANIRKIFTG